MNHIKLSTTPRGSVEIGFDRIHGHETVISMGKFTTVLQAFLDKFGDRPHYTCVKVQESLNSFCPFRTNRPLPPSPGVSWVRSKKR